jgi:4'-phosphopantetheinyl transferase EntD
VLEPILPAGVICVEGPILMEGWDAAPERDAAAAFGTKRKAEFLTGRTYARRALRLLGAESGPLPANADRSPRWPEGFVGCISHTRDVCAVIAAERGRYRSLGLDVESADRITGNIAAKVLVPEERAVLDASAREGDALAGRERMAAIFCAKEAFYKLQFPLTRAWLGFQDVEVDLAEGGRFALTLRKGISEGFGSGRVFEGRYRVADGLAAALMAI